jgi:predicted signal transduction protein with EAL and GGDEF domain
VGAAVFPADGESYEALLQVADSRMYEDKAARRQRRSERAAARAAHEHSDDTAVHGS